MFLNYLALFMVLCSLTAIFYLFIYIHELPYEAAKHRNHPQQDAIYIACWLSLFTLHAIWPMVFIWAVSHKEGTEAGGSDDWRARVATLEGRLARLEGDAIAVPGTTKKANKGGSSK